MSSDSQILIVNANSHDRTATARSLEQAGYHVTQAADGESALSQVRALRPALVLLDIFLPDLSGPEVLRQIRLDPTLIDVSVLMVSAYESTPEQQANCLDTGADGFMARPVDRAELLARVRSHLRRSQLTAERRVAEDALRTSERQFSNAFEYAVVGMALVAPGGELLKVNRALCQMLGYSEAELLKRDFQGLSHPEDMGLDSGKLADLLAGGIESFQMEKRYLHRLGHPVWTLLSVSLVRDKAGAPVHFISQVQDISARKKAAAELQRTTDLLQAVVEGTTDAVFVKDLDGRYLLVNESGARLAGLRVSDVIGKSDVDLFGPEDAKTVTEFDLKVIESNRAQSTEECLTAAGVTRTYLSMKAPYRDGHGNIIGVVGISRDITDRKRSQERIAEQAALIDQARDAIYERDMDHRITFWSKGAERIFGWTAAEALGCPANELLRADPEKFELADKQVRQAGEWREENHKTAKDGTVLTLDCRLTLVRDGRGQPRSILAIDTDISARKKIEQQLLRSQRMESIGTLAGGIAHDLNNVLSPIIMALDLMKVRFKDKASQELLEVVSASAHRGADMVRQVLTFARGVEGRRVEVSIDRLVRDIEKIASDTFLKSHRVRSRIPADLWTVMGDPTQLHQVLMNLSVNARDAMPNGGTLTISADNLHLDAHYAGLEDEAHVGPYIFIQVEDNGTGMIPEIAEKIFDPFFTTKEVGKGTGLGLSTSMAIVKSHGGFIQCYSELGNGTKFTVYLPAQTVALPAVDAEEEATMPHGNGELILVVDDEESVRQITRTTLEAYGYRVVLAVDGAEAVAIFASRRTEIAAVLTDMTMPVMDGAATIQILLRMDPKARIIAASGLSANAQDGRIRSLGVKCFLPKPYTAETLLNSLREVLAAP